MRTTSVLPSSRRARAPAASCEQRHCAPRLPRARRNELGAAVALADKRGVAGGGGAGGGAGVRAAGAQRRAVAALTIIRQTALVLALRSEDEQRTAAGEGALVASGQGRTRQRRGR